MRLAECLPRNSFVLYGDRFFSSLKLAFALRQRGIGYTGVINSSRLEKCPIDKKFEKKARGSREYAMDTSTGTLVVAWNDNKAVYMASTVEGIEPTHQTHRWSREKKTRVID